MLLGKRALVITFQRRELRIAKCVPHFLKNCHTSRRKNMSLKKTQGDRIESKTLTSQLVRDGFDFRLTNQVFSEVAWFFLQVVTHHPQGLSLGKNLMKFWWIFNHWRSCFLSFTNRMPLCVSPCSDEQSYRDCSILAIQFWTMAELGIKTQKFQK